MHLGAELAQPADHLRGLEGGDPAGHSDDDDLVGEAIVALCGKKWIPTRDPSRYPICPTCAERKAAGWTL